MQLGIGSMISSLFLKKIFYFFTTGTLLFYIVSFENAGVSSVQDQFRKDLLKCQENVRRMNIGRTFTIKDRFQITYKNVLRLNPAEQKAVDSYLKENKISFIKDGESNPLRITTFKFETQTNQTLGYKVVVGSWSNSTEVFTYFIDKEQRILFKHIDSLVPVKTWVCEKD